MEFKVRHSKKEMIVVVLILLLFEAVFIVGMVYKESNNFMNTVFPFIWLGYIVYAIMITVLFFIKVEGSVIKVRTKYGKRFEFNCADIEKISAYRSLSTRNGTSYYIYIETKLNKIEVKQNAGHNALEFDTLAKYLLDKAEAGEIKSVAVSPNSRKNLKSYINGNNS